MRYIIICGKPGTDPLTFFGPFVDATAAEAYRVKLAAANPTMALMLDVINNPPEGGVE